MPRARASGSSTNIDEASTNRRETANSESRGRRKGKARAVEPASDEVAEQDEEGAELNGNIDAKSVGNLSDDDDEADGEGEADAEGEEDEEEEGSSIRGAKRARVDQNGNARSVSQTVEAPRRSITLPRDVDGFIPGSIVRIQLSNFVTYDWVEFRPGPYLNMILGPNGTGKSSIACAICLGLNGTPALLGRGTDLTSFVKKGTEKAYIELELKGARGRPNLIIKRSLTSKSKSSQYTLNGTAATGKEINERMRELNVQVGNLCTFLPQDRVSEFAAMSPQQLLVATQKAAGDENLSGWHETLVDSGKNLKEMRGLITGERDQLKTMQDRNDQLEREVIRYKERKKIEHEIELLQVLIPVQEYREIRAKYTDTKTKQREIHAKVVALKDKNAPVHARLKKLGDDYKESEKQRDGVKKATQDKFKQMAGKWAASERLEAEAEDLSTKLDNLKKSEKERERKIKTLESDITRIEEELAKPLDLEDEAEVTKEAAQLNIDFGEANRQHKDLQEQQRANVAESSRYQSEIDDCMKELKKLDNEQHRKLQKLQNWDRNTHDTVLWLRNNQDKFKLEVFEPPCISVDVPNGKYVNAVEACFNAIQLKTFVCQCEEDYTALNYHINDTEGLGRKVRVATWFRERHEDQILGPPMSKEEMTALGFDGYAIDYIDCPDGLLWFMKKELNLHRTAIGLNGKGVDVAKAMQAVSRFGPNGEGGGANFIAGTIINQVQRSRYGKRAAQNMTRDVHPAKNFVSTAIDPAVKQALDKRIGDTRSQLRALEALGSELTKEEKRLREIENEYKAKITACKARWQAIKDAKKNVVTMQTRLERNKDSLKDLKSRPSIDVERQRLKKDLSKLTGKRINVARDYIGLIRGAMKDQTVATQIGLRYLQIGANKVALEKLCEEKDAEYNEAYLEFQRIDKEFQQVKERSKVILESSRQKVFGASGEIRAAYDAIEAPRLEWEKAVKEAQAAKEPAPEPGADVDIRTVEELRLELETQEHNLEMNINTNPGVVEQYEKRKLEIESLTKTIQRREAEAEKVERNIAQARESWHPALKRLVANIGKNFSRAFDRIGCAGEIKIGEHEDYEKWSIDILVKFRDEDKLHLLTNQRQSGGERSLTTILYLMSLTEEARSPFSLVDEINQGMDQRAERTVHNSMVEVTCKQESTQYFLITPKLLPDLNYHERMKVLCVNNGEWLPDERSLGNMMNMVENFVQRRNRAQNNP